MRHKYETRGIVLSRAPVGEASVFVAVLTAELGLVRALAQSVRKPSAKLASSLATFAESSVVLVRGKDGWRLSGAVLEMNWFSQLRSADARKRAGRVTGLLLRLVAGETPEPALFPVIIGFFKALAELPHELHEAAEILAALRILSVLGFDAGNLPGEISVFTPALLSQVDAARADYITRINHGIDASGL